MKDNPLRRFCRGLMDKYGELTLVGADVLAAEFVDEFGLQPRFSLATLSALTERVGIPKLVPAALPEGLAGLHASREDSWAIYYDYSSRGTRPHATILHEIYEIIWHHLRDLGAARQEDAAAAEREAEHFAAAVLLPAEEFRTDALRMGFDVVGLQRAWRRSYPLVARRLQELFEAELALSVVIFETPYFGPNLRLSDPSKGFQAEVSCSVWTAGWLPVGWCRRQEVFPLPRRGAALDRHSVCAEAYRRRKPIAVEAAVDCPYRHAHSAIVAIRHQRFRGSGFRIVAVGVGQKDSDCMLPLLHLLGGVDRKVAAETLW